MLINKYYHDAKANGSGYCDLGEFFPVWFCAPDMKMEQTVQRASKGPGEHLEQHTRLVQSWNLSCCTTK